MTRDYAKRVNNLRAHLQGAEVSTLIRIHGELLRIAPGIRVRARWGDRTSYAVKLRQAHAVELTSECEHPVKGDPLSRYRIEFGASLRDGIHAYMGCWEQAPQSQWEEWQDPILPDRIWEWMRKYQPAAEVLVEIDMILLQMGGGGGNG